MLVVGWMRVMRNWWIICAGVGLLCAQEVPLRESLLLEMIEVSGAKEGAHEFLLALDEKLRERHFLFTVDRSVCQGELLVNGSKLDGEDAVELLSFAQSNKVSIAGCIERSPTPVVVRAVPRVYLARAQAMRAGRGAQIELSVRNTLANSATVRVSVGGTEADFFVGPETSQTRTLFLRLVDRDTTELLLEMWKFPEALEGGYRHRLKVSLPRP
jgi:hypothetical protein